MFAQRLAGHAVARIARVLSDAGIGCPSAAGPGRNPHRPGTAWTLGTVTSVLASPRYTGRHVWNRQRTDTELVDPADVALGQYALPVTPLEQVFRSCLEAFGAEHLETEGVG